jgi:hypothetical protein
MDSNSTIIGQEEPGLEKDENVFFFGHGTLLFGHRLTLP